MYCRRPGIGVAEDAGHVDLHVLDVADGQREVAGAHADQDDVSGRTDRLDAADHGGGHAPLASTKASTWGSSAATSSPSGRAPRWRRSATRSRAATPRIGHDDARGAEGTGGLRADHADGSCARDEDRAARATCALRIVVTATDSGSSSAAASSDMESGTGCANSASMSDVAAEGAVDRRGGVELHVGTQVVATRGALLAAAARMLRLDGDALADPGAGRPARRRPRCGPTARGRGSSAVRRRSRRSARGGSSARPIRRRRPRRPRRGPGVLRASGTGRSSICSVPTPVITLARIVVVSVVISLPFVRRRSAGPGRRPSAGPRQRRTAAQSPR